MFGRVLDADRECGRVLDSDREHETVPDSDRNTGQCRTVIGTQDSAGQ